MSTIIVYTPSHSLQPAPGTPKRHVIDNIDIDPTQRRLSGAGVRDLLTVLGPNWRIREWFDFEHEAIRYERCVLDPSTGGALHWETM